MDDKKELKDEQTEKVSGGLAEKLGSTLADSLPGGLGNTLGEGLTAEELKKMLENGDVPFGQGLFGSDPGNDSPLQ